MKTRTCDQLGVCQANNPACNRCAVSIIPSVDAERNAADCMPSAVDDLAYFACLGAVGLATIVVVCGGAGYLMGWLG